MDPKALPDKWNCASNTWDAKHASCDVPEEKEEPQPALVVPPPLRGPTVEQLLRQQQSEKSKRRAAKKRKRAKEKEKRVENEKRRRREQLQRQLQERADAEAESNIPKGVPPPGLDKRGLPPQWQQGAAVQFADAVATDPSWGKFAAASGAGAEQGGPAVAARKREAHDRKRAVFWGHLNAFWDATKLSSTDRRRVPPKLCHKDLDFFTFYIGVVNRFGGYDAMEEKKGSWMDLFRELPNYSASETSASFRLKRIYAKFLKPFEEFNLSGIVPDGIAPADGTNNVVRVVRAPSSGRTGSACGAKAGAAAGGGGPAGGDAGNNGPGFAGRKHGGTRSLEAVNPVLSSMPRVSLHPAVAPPPPRGRQPVATVGAGATAPSWDGFTQCVVSGAAIGAGAPVVRCAHPSCGAVALERHARFGGFTQGIQGTWVCFQCRTFEARPPCVAHQVFGATAPLPVDTEASAFPQGRMRLVS